MAKRSLDDYLKVLKIYNHDTNPGYNTKNELRGAMDHSVGCACQRAVDFLYNQRGKSVPTIHAVVDGYEDMRVDVGVPEDRRTYHGGYGKNGNANSMYCGIELCEPAFNTYEKSSAQFHLTGCQLSRTKCESCSSKESCEVRQNALMVVNRTYRTAVWYFAYLCTKHGWNPDTCVLSHHEGYLRGVASGHVDPEHMWTDLASGITNDNFRSDIKAVMNGGDVRTTTQEQTVDPLIRIDDATIEDIAKVIQAEFGMAAGRNYECLLGVAQTAYDLWKTTGKTLSDTLKTAFTTPAEIYSTECLDAAYDVFVRGKMRFDDYQIIQFRSFTKYSDGNCAPDPIKCAELLKAYEYIGCDYLDKNWGHLYFGHKIEKEDLPKTEEPSDAADPIVYVYRIKVGGKQVASYYKIENALNDFSKRDKSENDVVIAKEIK